MLKLRKYVGVIAVSLPLTALAGPLTPPPGPVSSTQKTLDQIEPGTPLSQVSGTASVMHRITMGGRYYLDRDIRDVGPGITAIQVATNDGVVIDLNGFTIDGNNTEDRPAILLSSGPATIRNGNFFGYDDQIITEFDANLRLENLTVQACGDGTALMTVNRRTIIKDCTFNANLDPIVVTSNSTSISGFRVESCTFEGMPNAIAGSLVRGGMILDSYFSGVGGVSGGTKVVLGDASLISRCTFSGGAEQALDLGDDAQVLDSVFAGLGPTSGSAPAIVVGNRGIVSRCQVSNFGGNGIEGNFAVHVDRCVIDTNGGNGIQVTNGSLITNNIVRQNTADAILVTFDTTVKENTIDGDTIRITGSDNLIELNTTRDNSASIALDAASSGNLVIRNRVGAGSITNSGAASNIVGPIVTGAGLGTAGPYANIAF